MNCFDKTLGSTLQTWLTASLLALLVAGCGGTSGGASGTLGVSLTDAPACGFDAVNVTVSKVRVHQSSSASETDSGWSDIIVNRKINLLVLNNGVLDTLGQVPLAAGHYTQLRLVLDPNTAQGLANSVTPAGGTETTLVTPSAGQSGLKLVNEFDVIAGQRVDLLLDFDACKSIVKRGNGTYALKPVVKVIPFALNGIDGFVDPALLGSGVMVTAQQNGAVIRSTAPNATTGEFFLARLDPANYDVVITANSHATAVIAAVPVASSPNVVLVSNSASPITLPASSSNSISGTASLSPASASEVAYLAAKQSIGAPALVVTVQLAAADELSAPPGAYTLTLPIGAPMLGQYSATLPIALVAQPAAAGRYTAEASATGYQSQSVIKDISAASSTLNFILQP